MTTSCPITTLSVVLLFAMPLACSAHSLAKVGTTPSDDVYDIRYYGAVGDAKTDDTAAIQKAIDAAGRHGGVVQVPVGHWLCRGHLELKQGVHLRGSNETPQSWEPDAGSILEPTEGRGQEESPAFIEMRSSTSVTGITIYYPDQSTDNIQPYPWTIQIRANPTNGKDVSFDSTVQDVTLINSYNGIRTGPTENGRHRILGVHGTVLRRGIFIDWTGDIGRIENVQFSCHFWASSAFHGNFGRVFDYMQQHLEAFVFGRSDWEYVTNTFVFPAKTGYRFIETTNGATNGQFSGIGADATQVAFQVDAIQPQGLLVTNGEFDTHHVGASSQIVVSPGASGNLRFVNTAFWGPSEHNALLDGDAYVSFSDCYFSSDLPTAGAAIEAHEGKLQVNNSTFDARSNRLNPGHADAPHEDRFQPVSIHLGNHVRSAIVRGNNGYNGVKTQNEIGKRALFSDNETSSAGLARPQRHVHE